MKNMTDNKVYRIVLTALMAALCYVAFTFLKIPIPTFGGDYVALHIGNAFCVLAALLLGGVYGGLAGMRMVTLLQDDWRALGLSRRSQTCWIRFILPVRRKPFF